MRRAIHIGIFIGTLIGMSACAAAQPGGGPTSGAYGSIEAGRVS